MALKKLLSITNFLEAQTFYINKLLEVIMISQDKKL